MSYKYLGFTLTEILVAIFILAIGMMGLASLHLTNLRGNLAASYHSQATLIAEDLVERIRANKPVEQVYDNPRTGFDADSLEEKYSNIYCNNRKCYVCENDTADADPSDAQKDNEIIYDATAETNPFSCEGAATQIINCSDLAARTNSNDDGFKWCSDLGPNHSSDGTNCDSGIDIALNDIWTLYCGLPDYDNNRFIGGFVGLDPVLPPSSSLAVMGCVKIAGEGACSTLTVRVTWNELKSAMSPDGSDTKTTTHRSVFLEY